jgi:hypothetical protein
VLSLSVDIWRPVVSGGSQSLTAQVQALFAGGKVGGMWDMGDTATLFQDAAGATPVTAVTQPIGRVNDKSGNGNNATQPTAGSRPLFSARKNLLVKSEDFADAVWQDVSAGIAAKTYGQTDPLGGSTAVKLVGNNASTWLAQNIGAVNEANYALSMWIRADAPVSVDILISYGATNISTVSVTTSWQRFSFYAARATTAGLFCGLNIGNGNNIYIWRPQVEVGASATTYQRVNTTSDYDTVGFPAFAQFDAVDDALLFPAITFGGAFNTFVASKVTGGTSGIHLWRTADVNGTWAKYKSGDATTPTGTGSGSPTYAVNGTALSPSQQGQLYTQINGVDSVVESIGVVLTAETALQLSGFVGSLFTGNAHRVLMISGTLTAAEKLLCRRWAAEGNGATVV